MLHCDVCGSAPFKRRADYERHCLTQKHLKALAAQQKEQESQRLSRQTAAIAAAVCEEREDQIPAIIAEYAALAAHQEEASSSSYACAVCAGSSFVSKRNYEQHCLSQKHLKALAAQQEEAAACTEREGHIAASIAQTQQEEAVACKEREDHIAASIAQNVAPSKKKQRCSKASEEVENHVKEVLPKKSSPEEAFNESRNAAMDAGLQKAAAFFSAPNITRATCACCYELHKLKNVIFIKAQELVGAVEEQVAVEAHSL